VPAAKARPTLAGVLTGAARKARSGTAALEWRSCGSKKDPMQLQKMEIVPNPVKIPGMLRAEMALLVKEPINPPIKVKRKNWHIFTLWWY
jgi:hypothetical protein